MLCLLRSLLRYFHSNQVPEAPLARERNKIFVLDTIKYYNENNIDCYLLLLDASKAFDRVEYVKLFKMLKYRNMCPIVLRLLMNMYVNQME